MDVEHMRGFSPIRDRQYFEEFVPLKQGEVFVDAGGYDGLTSRQYAMWNPGYRKIYYFEPVPAMMEVSRRNLMSVRDVHFVQKALFSRNDKLRFDASCGERSWISAGGQTEVEAVSLDEEVPEPVTFIKMDIEGAEYEAILGATEHIKSDVPTLAICIYHTQQHFWQVPLRVLELSDCYRLYVRHYSEGVVDTVMFFVPKREQNRG
jgi:FkbM family methyltransferase